ncbi:hypothetical protein M5K25_020703 [Dendrobium thyrsiflorum]|uniref:Uncharacterized protein n=1 Tax=Dendrobium thyrsiflorum TaxID=117978 RepID=A0ABD0UAN7_DENTH
MPPLEPLSREEMSMGYDRRGADFVGRREEFHRRGADFEGRREEFHRQGADFEGRMEEFHRRGADFEGRRGENDEGFGNFRDEGLLLCPRAKKQKRTAAQTSEWKKPLAQDSRRSPAREVEAISPESLSAFTGSLLSKLAVAELGSLRLTSSRSLGARIPLPICRLLKRAETGNCKLFLYIALSESNVQDRGGVRMGGDSGSHDHERTTQTFSRIFPKDDEFSLCLSSDSRAKFSSSRLQAGRNIDTEKF